MSTAEVVPDGHYKDEVLSSLATTANVAQFVSFGPDARQRFSRVRGYRANHDFGDPVAAASTLIALANNHMVNVRTFDPENSKGNPFHRNLTDPHTVAELVHSEAEAGRFSIVNESIDVNDGGVSGVSLGGIMEFAPGDTPRCVEKPGTLALPSQIAQRLFETVYGFRANLPFSLNERVEFSVHPLRVGHLCDHTVIWEVEWTNVATPVPDVQWPNHFSRLIGDKAFGLLLSWLVGLPVPRTLVISRYIAPFEFGADTGTNEHWIRTAPPTPVPGHFTTQRGWVDPFALLHQEAPNGEIASVLDQLGVDSQYSGAAGPRPGGGYVIEGVRGFGDDFMLGRSGPTDLPPNVLSDVTAMAQLAEAHFGPVRFEWAHDGEASWLLQLHIARHRFDPVVIHPGDPQTWRTFDASLGLEALVRLIDDVLAAGEGILVQGRVGVTSHVGDLLRKAGVPSKIIQVVSPVQLRLR